MTTTTAQFRDMRELELLERDQCPTCEAPLNGGFLFLHRCATSDGATP